MRDRCIGFTQGDPKDQRSTPGLGKPAEDTHQPLPASLKQSGPNSLPAEVEPDPEPPTPPEGISEGGIEYGRDFAKDLHPLPWHRVRQADWRRDARTVSVRFDEPNLTVSAKNKWRTL